MLESIKEWHKEAVANKAISCLEKPLFQIFSRGIVYAKLC
jgi:hypothetical protein